MSDPVREVREIASTGEWLAWRQRDITASRIGALFDAHPYMTRDDLARILKGTVRGDATDIPGDSPAMRRGRILEPAVAAAVTEEHPEWQLAKATTYHRLPDHRLGATPDFWANADGLIQCKTVSPHQWELWHARPPLAYTLQTLCELIVTGRAWGVLAVMVVSPSFPVHYFDVPRHPAAEKRILDAVSAWWHAFDAGEIAAPVSSAELAADLDDGSYRDLSTDNELPALLVERAHLKAAVGSSEKRLKEIDYQVKNRMGPAKTGWLPGWEISFGSYTRRETIIPATTIRTLRIKATVEGNNATE
jgi:predicted phage-related endonuclease